MTTTNYQERLKLEQRALRQALDSFAYGNTVNDQEIAAYLADKKNATTYDDKPVVGYSYGLIRSNKSPERITANGNSNDWFILGNKRYNVHPHRADLGGYPVRWIEPV